MRKLGEGLGDKAVEFRLMLDIHQEAGQANFMTGSRLAEENVWDYPRPPALEPVPHKLRVVHAGAIIAETSRAMRVIETSHPPVYYFPLADIQRRFLHPAGGVSYCEFKGVASYWSLKVGDLVVEHAAWSYPEPTRRFEKIRNYLAFYASKLDLCEVAGERVSSQRGQFYGGWITSNLKGPFKGASGTEGW